MKITTTLLEAMGFNRQNDGSYGMHLYGMRWLKLTQGADAWQVEVGYLYSTFGWVGTVERLLEALILAGEKSGRESTQQAIKKAIGVWDA